MQCFVVLCLASLYYCHYRLPLWPSMGTHLDHYTWSHSNTRGNKLNKLFTITRPAETLIFVCQFGLFTRQIWQLWRLVFTSMLFLFSVNLVLRQTPSIQLPLSSRHLAGLSINSLTRKPSSPQRNHCNPYWQHVAWLESITQPSNNNHRSNPCSWAPSFRPAQFWRMHLRMEYMYS